MFNDETFARGVELQAGLNYSDAWKSHKDSPHRLLIGFNIYIYIDIMYVGFLAKYGIHGRHWWGLGFREEP